MRGVQLRLLVCVVALGALTAAASASAAVDFNQDVRPIFAAKCMRCHGPQKSQGGLRLDLKRHAFGPTDSGTPALQTDKPEESALLRRVTSEDDSERMPPEGDPLTVNEIAILRAWLGAGAAWPEDRELPKHWAYVLPVRGDQPAVHDPAWVRNDLDRFILARLEKEGLAPSAEAEPAVLCRRLYLDLVGLPPTPDEVTAFVRDYALPDASDDPGQAAPGNPERTYEAVVDRLLSSPHFGERWARHWLDLARYADSNGFQRDGFRTIWAYRDWVVDALNRDMPYTDFALRQIAGDLLPDATLETKIATGFNRCTTVNVEAGTDPEENRVLAVIDRVNTMATVFLGTTLACAQCHNHKYDPFTQVEYYRLLAYFNSTQVEITPAGSARQFTGPSLPLPMLDVQQSRRAELTAQLAALEARLTERTVTVKAMEPQLLARIRQSKSAMPEWHVLPTTSFDSSGGATPVVLPDNSVLLTEDRPEKDVYSVTVHTPLQAITGFKLETLTDDSLPGEGPGRGDAQRPNFVLNEWIVKAAPQKDSSNLIEVALYDGAADYSQPGFAPAQVIDGNTKSGGWAIAQEFHQPHYVTFRTRQPIGHDGGTVFKFELHQNFGAGRTIGRLRFSAMTGDSAAATPVPAPVAAALEKPAESRTAEETKRVNEYCLSLDADAQQIRKDIAKTREQLETVKIPSTLVMVELPQPRMTAVMKRGNFLDPGAQVTPGTPAALHPLPENAPANRLGLARWIADPQNPLLARVAVNRWWAELFGRGIVATQEDLGSQSEKPTHPELLDWLALQLAERNWSMKQVLKTIVTSATYRQSSRTTSPLLRRDPYNLLYARGARFRIPAEMIRDNALAVAGLLNLKIGGPPVYPPQPEGIWRVTGEVDNKYYTSTGDDRYRRGLYTIWRRSAPYPSFVNFDAPERSACVAVRPRTNTPLQALTLLNDPVYVETAGALARRIAAYRGSETGACDDAARVEHGFRLVLARSPKPVEKELLLETFGRERDVFRHDAGKAAKVLAAAKLTAAKPPADKPPAGGDEDAATLAAWYQIATLLLNLDEAITKG